jgi:hypothetical protein
MFYSRTAIERRGDRANSLLPSIAESDLRRASSSGQRVGYAAEPALDQVLADSFPASDPPSWTPGVARPGSPGHDRSAESRDGSAVESGDRALVELDVADRSLPRNTARTFIQGLTSLTGAAGIALLVPFVILLIGLPVALVVGAVAEAVGWLLAQMAG